MRAVVQRVKESRVEIGGEVVGQISKGFLVLLGVAQGDDEQDCSYLADKIANLRIFPDEKGQMNLSLLDAGGEILVVSQFTLLGDCKKGRRPSFAKAAKPPEAQRLYEEFVRVLRAKGIQVETGRFQEMMDVYLINDGPVTLLLDSKKAF
ncbi:MAG TPA: D-tyrosyl-tRNA(Tyr) deacylase [Desulfobacterales bacterium]|nr:D-tyrosyl-tRNA(Tyr) deacylase [Desulfobacterales bacterium]